MRPIDEQVQTVIELLRKAGGNVYVPVDASEDVKKGFLEMILSCPDCVKTLEITKTKVKQ